MIKNRRLKKNWSSEDIMILAWIVGKYAQYHSIKKMDQFVNLTLFREFKIGKNYQHLFLEPLAKDANSGGSIFIKINSPPINGKNNSPFF